MRPQKTFLIVGKKQKNIWSKVKHESPLQIYCYEESDKLGFTHENKYCLDIVTLVKIFLFFLKFWKNISENATTTV